MKLIINYDFFDKVKDAKEPFGPLKIIRNNKGLLVVHFAACMGINMAKYSPIESLALYGLDFIWALCIFGFMDSMRNGKKDPYFNDAKDISNRTKKIKYKNKF